MDDGQTAILDRDTRDDLEAKLATLREAKKPDPKEVAEAQAALDALTLKQLQAMARKARKNAPPRVRPNRHQRRTEQARMRRIASAIDRPVRAVNLTIVPRSTRGRKTLRRLRRSVATVGEAA